MSNRNGQMESTKERETRDEVNVSVTDAAQPSSAALPSETELFELYERIVETRPGSRDAEIFEKIREWTFSDFSMPACEFAGISRTELAAWQKRHRINLSAGHIRPATIDLDRGHAWGTIRRNNHVNKLHIFTGPPSADEIAMDLSGFLR